MLIPLFLFLVGICVGSFLNVIIDRLPREETIFVGRSHCDFCKHTLDWFDMFPIFSFVLLKGKCRYCHKFIGWKYPLVELTSGILFAVLPFLISPFNLPLFLVILGICSCFIIIFYTDLFSGIIPDSMIVVLFILAILRIVLLQQSLPLVFLTGCISGIFFLLLHLITRGRGMGLGDVKYAFVMGLLLGFPIIIIGLYVAFLTGTALALILVLGKKKSFASSIPFGPFLIIGTFAGLFWGNILWNIFLRVLNL